MPIIIVNYTGELIYRYYIPGPEKPDMSRARWCAICQKMPLMLRNKYTKYIGGIGARQKIILKNRRRGSF